MSCACPALCRLIGAVLRALLDCTRCVQRLEPSRMSPADDQLAAARKLLAALESLGIPGYRRHSPAPGSMGRPRAGGALCPGELAGSELWM